MPSADPVADERVAAVRDFNRFFARRIGVLREGLLDTVHPLPDARVLFELGRRAPLAVTDLRATLDIDAGFLSRLLGRLEAAGLVRREHAPGDGRRRVVVLTGAGQAAFEDLDARSAGANAELLRPLPEPTQRRLLAGMTAVRAALEPARAPDAPVLRAPRPGDLGWIVERHGALYAAEYGWDASFETLVAGIVSAFATGHDPARERAWIADLGGERAGCVMCVAGDAPAEAKLRLLLVEPWARGAGVGAALVGACLTFARERGYARMTLWTNDILVEARRLYERAGFALESEAPHRAFGHDLVEQTWGLAL